MIPPRLRLPSSADHLTHCSNPLVHEIHHNILDFVDQVDLPTASWNLTPGERWGLNWLRRKTSSRSLVVSPADKGGALLVFDGEIVDNTIVGDAFGKELPIMAIAKNKKTFLSFYINMNFFFGKRW